MAVAPLTAAQEDEVQLIISSDLQNSYYCFWAVFPPESVTYVLSLKLKLECMTWATVKTQVALIISVIYL